MSGLERSIVIGDTLDPTGSDCCCCTDSGAETQQVVTNRSGLSAIAYRVGTHSSFKHAMLARLSSADLPALRLLQTRDDDDFSIALVDAWATVSDVLTFYQERVANESYLRTATERRSVVELARLIGYRARPGVAASTYLAFAMEEAAGAPEQAVKQTSIEPGVRVRSIPGPGQQAQTFETIEATTARLEWSAMKALQRRRVTPSFDTLFTYLAGTATQLKPGDIILLVGSEREQDVGSERWDVRRVKAVELDHAANQTRVEWGPGLGSAQPYSEPAENPRLYALRLRASLFGYNAPDPRSLLSAITFSPVSTTDWEYTVGADSIDLDNAYSPIVPGSWLVLSRPTYRELYRALQVTELTRADYGMTGKSTQVRLDTDENLSSFDGGNYRDTVAFAQSEELPLGEAPVDEPVVRGKSILLDRLVADPGPGRKLIVRGKRARFKVASNGLNLTPSAGSSSRKLTVDEVLTVLSAPKLAPWGLALGIWSVRDEDGIEGLVTATAKDFSFVPARKEDQIVVELAELKGAEPEDGRYTRLVLSSPLVNIYDLQSAEILGNVALATHGETTSEILGNGDAAATFQEFTLKQTPLTYVSSQSASGAESTLNVRVGDVLWHEVPALYARGAGERVFHTRTADDGRVTVEFGDGASGARLPSGQNNVRATYRKGIGLGGSVDAGQLSMLSSRPLGVKSVVNPLAADGAADPELLDDARENAPIGVLTLDRTVSLRDYEDFARGFAGVGKALATWAWDGRMRRVFVTIAGANGAEVESDSNLYRQLLGALGAAGDPFVTFEIKSYRAAHFRIALKVKIDPDYLADKVQAAVEAALRARFAFRVRQFGQSVAMSEVISAAQDVAGVVAVDLDRLYRTTPPFDTAALHPRLSAALPAIGADGRMVAAELLTLDPGPLEALGVMP